MNGFFYYLKSMPMKKLIFRHDLFYVKYLVSLIFQWYVFAQFVCARVHCTCILHLQSVKPNGPNVYQSFWQMAKLTRYFCNYSSSQFDSLFFNQIQLSTGIFVICRYCTQHFSFKDNFWLIYHCLLFDGHRAVINVTIEYIVYTWAYIL